MNIKTKGKIVSNKIDISVFERLWKLWAMICKMIMDGVRDPERVAEILQTIVDGAGGVKIYLKRLFEKDTIIIPATTGKETEEQLKALFPGGIYGESLPVPYGKSTPDVTVIVHELVEDGKFSEFLPTLGENRPRLQSLFQVGVFCRDNRDKLRTEGYATFFELERGFVARVFFVGSGQLEVRVDPFSDDYVWSAKYRHRVVSPQQ